MKTLTRNCTLAFNCFFSLALIIMALGCATSQKKTDTAKANTTVEESQQPTLNFAISNIHNWEVGKLPTGQPIYLSPLANETDTFRENINIISDAVPQGITEEQYIEATVQNFSKALSLPTPVTYSKTKVSTYDGYMAHIVFTQGDFNLSLDSYLVFENSTAYIISCTAQKDSYDQFKPMFESIVNTFSIQ